MPQIHSKKYSPSKSAIWTKCALSTLLNQGDDSFDSEQAQFGSESHELARSELAEALHVTDYEEDVVSSEELKKKLPRYNDDMQAIVDYYREAGVNLFNYYKNQTGEEPLVFLETHIDMDFDETAGGTLDFGLYSSKDGGTIVVGDLKTGRRPIMACDPENKKNPNSQLGLYAIYFYESVIKGLYPVKNVRLIIYQPVINNTNEYSLSLEDLLKYKEEVIIPAVLKTKVNDLEAKAGSHCGYCAGRHVCVKYHESNLAIGESISKPIEEFSDEQIEAILPKLDAFLKYAEDLKDYAIEKAKSGHKWKGLKLVPSKISRKISDEEKVKKILEECGINPNSPGKILGITEIQKKLGKEKFKELISPYIVLQESALILVPESDPRDEVVVTNKEEK